jgi:hypothetical protein
MTWRFASSPYTKEQYRKLSFFRQMMVRAILDEAGHRRRQRHSSGWQA